MKPTIPHPDNPQHANNLCTTNLLEAQGFEGPDACMRISTLEYGAAWRTLPDGQLLFIYGIGADNKGEYNRFDRSTLAPDYDVFKEHNWVKWDEFFSTIDANRDDWTRMPLGNKLYDLLCVHGYENIFGSSYWEGFRIFEHCELIDCHNDPSRMVVICANKTDGIVNCANGTGAKEFMLCDEHAKQLGC